MSDFERGLGDNPAETSAPVEPTVRKVGLSIYRLVAGDGLIPVRSALLDTVSPILPHPGVLGAYQNHSVTLLRGKETDHPAFNDLPVQDAVNILHSEIETLSQDIEGVELSDIEFAPGASRGRTRDIAINLPPEVKELVDQERRDIIRVLESLVVPHKRPYRWSGRDMNRLIIGGVTSNKARLVRPAHFARVATSLPPETTISRATYFSRGLGRGRVLRPRG